MTLLGYQRLPAVLGAGADAWLPIVDEERTDDGEDDARDGVNYPVYAEVLDAEQVDDAVRYHKEVELTVPPLADVNALVSAVQPVEYQQTHGEAEVQAGYSVVHRVVVGDELEVPAVVVQQRIHSWNVRGGDLDVEEQVQGYCEQVDD